MRTVGVVLVFLALTGCDRGPDNPAAVESLCIDGVVYLYHTDIHQADRQVQPRPH